jgi:ribose-phosphate pyrophosphokinase
MKTLVFALPGNEAFADTLAGLMPAERRELTLHEFPDGEVRVRIADTVAGRTVLLVASLHRPDRVALPLYLVAATLRDLGASKILLVAPYLAYMRQDCRFHPGEGISARYFARWLSGFVDGLATVDPHLHRIHALSEVYSIPAIAVAAAPAIASWVRDHIANAVLIGPDAESEQWVAEVAQQAGCAYTILQKNRHGDRNVSVSLPDTGRWQDHTPVLVDDIISTGRTLMAAIGHLKAAGMRAPVCIGVHAVFADATTEPDLLAAGAARVVTCNTISHDSNGIDISPLLLAAVATLEQEPAAHAPA